MSTTTNEKGRDSGKSATQTTGSNHTAGRCQPICQHAAPSYAGYESLKASLAACATTPAEYERACHQAACLAGV